MSLLPNKKWFAIYTSPRAEKKVADRLTKSGIECYLPLFKQLKKWSDRKKWVEEPLFKSYLFVSVSEAEYYQVLNTNGVVRYITFGGKAVPVPEADLDIIKKLLIEYPDELEAAENLAAGSPIEIIAGPMMGVKGELVDFRGEKRASIRVEYINQSLLINIPSNFLAPLEGQKPQPIER
jgi:transcription antitermination factor NusG